MRHVTIHDPLATRILIIRGGRPRGGSLTACRELEGGGLEVSVNIDPQEPHEPRELLTLPASEVWVDTAWQERWADAQSAYQLAEGLRKKAEDSRELCTCGHTRRAHHSGGVDDAGCTGCTCTAYVDERAALTRERDEARVDLEKVAAAHKMVGSSADEIAAAVEGLRQAAITQDTANEELVGSLRQSRADAARLRGALEAVLHQLQHGEASDGDARDIAWCVDQARAALAGEGEAKPGRTLDRHGADRGRWVGVWDAINRYSEACGGSPTAGGPSRMEAVVEVERALDAALAGEGEVEARERAEKARQA